MAGQFLSAETKVACVIFTKQEVDAQMWSEIACINFRNEQKAL